MKKVLCCLVFFFASNYCWSQTKALAIICKPPMQYKAGQSFKLQVKVIHHLKEEKTGNLILALYNHETGKSVDGWFINVFPFQYFTTIDKENFEVEFPFSVPHEYKGSFDIELVAKVQDQKDSVRYTVKPLFKK